MEKLAEWVAGINRPIDVLQETGAKEFVIMVNATPLSGAGQYAERLCAGIENYVSPTQSRAACGTGVAERNKDGDT